VPIGKLFKNSSQHILRNKGLAFASVIVMTLTFLISSTFGVAFYVATNILDYVDKKIPVKIFIENTASEDQIKYIESTVKSINPSAITKYNSKEVSYEIYTKANVNDPSLTYDVNPSLLPAFIDINVANQKDALDIYNKLLDKLLVKTDKTYDEVKKAKENFMYKGKDLYLMKDDFKYIVSIRLNQKTSEFFKELRNTVQIVGVVMAIFLIVVSLIIIFITTGMAIYSNREEIETMELVGATPAYVRIPYIFDGAIFGFFGALVSTSILYLAGWMFIYNNAGGIVPFLNSFFAGIEWVNLGVTGLIGLFFGLLAIGSFIGALASAIATKRYLK